MRHAVACSLLAATLLASGCADPQPDCTGDAVVCAGTCTNLRSDGANCGACGNACAPGTACSAGTCQVSCGGGLLDCGGDCVDPLSDRQFCGASGDCAGENDGVACEPGEVCSAGACALSCQAGLVDCDGTCVDPDVDPRHCGADDACGGGQSCGPGYACSGGTCQVSCLEGFVDCGGRCVDPATDRAFCGATGDCVGANDGEICAAGTVCSDGACVSSCAPPLVACATGCADERHDPENCGGCGVTCAGAPNAAPVCLDRSCSYACNSAYLDCDGSAADGCEVDGATDDANCGGCGVACGDVPNGTTRCAAGICAVSACSPGHADCDGAGANGCEASTVDDPLNCGACGNECGPTEFCNLGTCDLLGGAGTVGDPYRAFTPLQSCLAYKTAIPSAADGYYQVDPALTGALTTVRCDQSTDGGGWTRCLEFVNTAAEDVKNNTWFDRCVDWSNASWQSGAIQIALKDAGAAVVYRTTGLKTVAWTYDQITSTAVAAEQYYSLNHSRQVSLANGDKLMITGRYSSNSGCGGSLGNGYGILVYPASPNYYSNEKILVMPYQNQVGYAGARGFMGWTTQSEITYAPGTMNSCTGGLPPGFVGTFEFFVR
jgi:hypothetical protein